MMIHPATAHFAMVLPVVASVFGVLYLINKQEIFSRITSALMFFTALAMAGVWYSGSIAGPEIYDFLSETGQQQLIEHKKLGLYLALAMGFIFFLKIIASYMKKLFIEVVSILALIALMFTTFIQGKAGGELVYNHGTPFKSYMIMDTLREAAVTVEEEEQDSDKIEIYEEALEDINLIDDEIEIYYGNKVEQE